MLYIKIQMKKNYNFYYKVNDSDDEYTSAILKDSDFNTFTISNLTNSSIYTLSYYRATNKREGSISKVQWEAISSMDITMPKISI